MLAVLANPTVAFVLLLIALLGVGLEAVHPGSLVFGSVGVLAGVLAAVGLLNLPVNLAGVVVVGAAAALLALDTSGHTHGFLSLAGVGAAIAGGLLLFNGSTAASSVNLVVLISLPVAGGMIWLTLSRRALRVRHLPFAATSHELLGLTAVVREGGDPSGIASVEGELWRVVSRDGEPLKVGAEVVVMAQDGLTLIVEAWPGRQPVIRDTAGSEAVPGSRSE
jgi:membrane-bound serine protease (ClpP class)